ncbi:unnamed protein product, partial [marine sediment metagenome]
DEHKYSYTRHRHPNENYLCEQITNLYDCSRAILFSSGTSAIFNTLSTYASNKSFFLVSSEIYISTKKIIERLKRIYPELVCEFFNAGDDDDLIEKVKLNKEILTLIITESCTNPNGYTLNSLTYRKINKISPNCVTVVDNTWLSSVVFNPIMYGANIVVESLTKYVSGGSVIMGVAVGQRKKIEKIESTSCFTGNHVSPFDCWLVSESIKTLGMRIEKSFTMISSIIHYLEKNVNVLEIKHPLCESHPDYHKASKILNLGPSVITFYSNLDPDILNKNLNKCNIILKPVSLILITVKIKLTEIFS